MIRFPSLANLRTSCISLTHIGCLLLVLLLTGCVRAPTDTALEESPTLPASTPIRAVLSPAPTLTASAAPTSTQIAASPQGELELISPAKTTEVSGGEDLHIAFYLADQDDLPAAGAAVEMQLWDPNGELFALLPCEDQGQGRYIAEYVRLPSRGSGGEWQIIGNAVLENGQELTAEYTFSAIPSPNEVYQERYGFWVERPRLFGLGTGFYNLQGSGGFHFEDWLNEDGSGYVVLNNYRYGTVGITFATMEVHWRQVEFPTGEAAAIQHAESLAESGLHHQDPDTDVMNMAANEVSFQDQPAWLVSGEWKETFTSPAAAARPAEWLIFRCPGSDWLWSLAISTNRVTYMDHLHMLQETFECPLISE